MDTLTFNSQETFEQFLIKNEEVKKSKEFKILNKPIDISISSYKELIQILISFNSYSEFILFMHPKSNELLLADMNLGGHGARCRVVKIKREDIFEYPNIIRSWYDNFSDKMWR